MRIIIGGAGETGRNLAIAFVEEGNDVIIIEKDREVCDKIKEEIDALVIEGNCASYKIFESGNLEGSDLFIATTDNDEVNILACMVSKHFDVKKTICRISNFEYLDKPMSSAPKFKRLGIDLAMSPELIASEKIARILEHRYAIDCEYFSEEDIKMIEFPILNPDIHDHSLEERIFPKESIIVGISRGDQLIIPRGKDKLFLNDKIVILAKSEVGPLLESICCGTTGLKPISKVMVVGAGTIGFYLAKLLSERGIKTILVEKNKKTAEKMAKELPKVLVLFADGKNIEVLKSEKGIDAYVACTGSDETNLLGCILAKRLGIPKSIALVHNPSHQLHFEMGGIDSVICPRLEIVSEVLRFTRETEILSLSFLTGKRAEIVEYMVSENKKIVGKRLKDIKMPKDSIVGMIIRGNKTIIPSGNEVIQARDKVIVFTLTKCIDDVENIFK
ncbi:MAG: Trk system potassium transporter TrkA [Candidatus Hydrothermarchaeota archaeon]